jgi:hypothetical protein
MEVGEKVRQNETGTVNAKTFSPSPFFDTGAFRGFVSFFAFALSVLDCGLPFLDSTSATASDEDVSERVGEIG